MKVALRTLFWKTFRKSMYLKQRDAVAAHILFVNQVLTNRSVVINSPPDISGHYILLHTRDADHSTDTGPMIRLTVVRNH